MGEIDKKHKLDTEPFTYEITKENKILIYWQGKQVSTLKGKSSEKLRNQLKNANAREVQLYLAKVTGNFKRGNEKDNKKND